MEKTEMGFSKMTKQDRYKQLIADVRQSYFARQGEQCADPVKLRWCEYCKLEINLWSYWQNSLDAKIMLVGQDWGCPCDESSLSTMQRIRQVNEGTGEAFFPDFDGASIWTTDNNLAVLFQILGYDIHKKQPDLFFTNFVLGYRNHGTSGPFRQKWLRDDAPYFKRLAEIIEPETIICLGKNTFEGVMFALTGKMERIRGFNRFLDGGENYRAAALPSGKPVRVYAVAHCGTIGTMNRNRGKKAEDGSNLSSKEIAVQKQDWERIKANRIQKK
jgi:hypothetical protein